MTTNTDKTQDQMRFLTMPSAEIQKNLNHCSERASPGLWCQFHPEYNTHARDKFLQDRVFDFDTSHHISAVIDRDGKIVRNPKIIEAKHAYDAVLAEKLVNLYRAGRLKVVNAKKV